MLNDASMTLARICFHSACRLHFRPRVCEVMHDRRECGDSQRNVAQAARRYAFQTRFCRHQHHEHFESARRSRGFDRFIISATSPFTRDDLKALRNNPASVVRRHCPAFEVEYAQRGWRLPASIDRVYVNDHARNVLGWRPRYDFSYAIERLHQARNYRSPLAIAVGAKGYHDRVFEQGPYPIE